MVVVLATPRWRHWLTGATREFGSCADGEGARRKQFVQESSWRVSRTICLLVHTKVHTKLNMYHIALI